MRLLNANPLATFTDFIYSLSGIFVAPFMKVFSNNQIEGNVLEWNTLLAMLVYWLIALALIKLFVMSKSVSTSEADMKLTDESS